MHVFRPGERERFAHEASETLTQGVIEALDMRQVSIADAGLANLGKAGIFTYSAVVLLK